MALSKMRQLPWNGGLNDSVDPGILPPSDLVEADNIVFATNGARRKRQGHSFVDSEVPTVIAKSSSGTTRTLYFSEQVRVTSPTTNDILVAGETVTVTSTDATEETNYGTGNDGALIDSVVTSPFSAFDFVDADVTVGSDSVEETAHGLVTGVQVDLTTTGTLPTGLTTTSSYYTIRVDDDNFKLASSLANAQAGTAIDLTAAAGGGTHTVTPQGSTAITYTAAGSLTQALQLVTETVTVSRADSYIALHDFWPYSTSNNAKEQEIFVVSKIKQAASNELKMFSYSISGRRTYIPARSEQLSNQTFDANTDVDTGSAESISITAHGFLTGDRVVYDNDGGTTIGGLSNDTTYYVIKVDDDTLQLASSRRNAENEVAINLTSKPGGSETQKLDVDIVDDSWANPVTRVNLLAMNERLIISFDAYNVKPRIYEPTLDSFRLLEGGPPDFFTMNVHESRVWTNDKNNPDRLHYSPPSDPELWQGLGDSAALDIAKGDGDEQGISGVFPTYKQVLFVGKGARMYRILGTAPENYQPEEVTSSLGVESAQSIASIDLDDMVFASHKGIHSLAATSQFGDFEDKFISRKIQNRFQEQLNRGQIDSIQAAYIPTLNSVAFAVAESGSDDLNALLFYNIKEGEWYRWPSLNLGCIGVVKKQDDLRSLYYGTRTARLVRTQNGTFTDFANEPIRMYLKSGIIYPDQDPESIKGFKKATLFYRPTGNFVFTATYKIDNAPVQAIDFQQAATGALLGDTFVLGESLLSFDNTFAPFTRDLNGFGRGVIIEIEDSSVDAQIDIYGFGFEYDSRRYNKETLGTGTE